MSEENKTKTYIDVEYRCSWCGTLFLKNIRSEMKSSIQCPACSNFVKTKSGRKI